MIRSAYTPPERSQISFNGPGRTKQSHKEECDINNIMNRYERTGILDFRAKHEGRYGDATGGDFRQAMEIIREADEMFEDLPAGVRKRFANDPAEFLDFVNNPENRDEARKLGLLSDEPPKAAPAKSAAKAADSAEKTDSPEGEA